MECRFFTILKAGSFFGGTPLAPRFWAALRDESSAASLFDGDLNIGLRLITLDLLDTLLSCWISFADEILRRSIWSDDFDDSFPLAKTRQHVDDFSKAVRDLGQTIEACIEVLQASTHFDAGKKAKLELKVLTVRHHHKVVQSLMSDVESIAANSVTQAESSVNQRQERSLRRLTLVASIFLPLTLACSLLSMTNRVNELGALWWDWLGIVVIIALVVTTGYRITTTWHEASKRLKDRFYLPFYQFRQLWLTALSNAKKKESKRLTRSRHLIPLVTLVSFKLSKYMFLLGLMVSFIIGMFASVSTGAQSLGYSTAIAFGLGLLIISIWRLLSALRTALRHFFRGTKGKTKTTLPDEESSHKPRKAKWPPWVRITFWATRWTAKALFLVVKLLLKFFYGQLIFATAGEFEWELVTYVFPEQEEAAEPLPEAGDQKKANASSTTLSSATAEKIRRDRHEVAAIAALIQSLRDKGFSKAMSDAFHKQFGEAIDTQGVQREYIEHRWQLQEKLLPERFFRHRGA